MTPLRLFSKAAALLQILWSGAAAVYAHAQCRRAALRACRRRHDLVRAEILVLREAVTIVAQHQHDLVRAEILVLREAVTIVAQHRDECRAFYGTPHINHPNHVRT